MTQFVRHVEKTGPVYPICNYNTDPRSFETAHFLLPRAEYRLCTEQGEWIPEWKDVTSECRIDTLSKGRRAIAHHNTLVMHPANRDRYRVTFDTDVLGAIMVEERV